MKETLQATTSECTLDVTLDLSQAGMVRVDYRLHNDSTAPLYLCDQFWEDITEDARTHENIYQVQPDLVNVQLRKGMVIIGKTVVDVPFPKLVEVRHVPCLHRVEPGAIYEQTVTLSLPLLPYTVYEGRHTAGPIASLPVQFELGYVIGSNYVERVVKQVHTAVGAAHYLPPFPAKDQAMIRVGPFHESIAVANSAEALVSPSNDGQWTPWS